jgi:O-antigen ligase
MKTPRWLLMITGVAVAIALFTAICTIWVTEPWSIALFEIVEFSVAALWLIYFSVRPFQISFSLILAPLLAMVLLGFLQYRTGITVSRWDTRSESLLWLSYLAACFLGLQIGSHPGARATFLSALLYFGLALSIIGLLTFYISPDKVFGFFEPNPPGEYLGPFYNKDHYAAWIELLLPLALYLMFTEVKNILIGVVMSGMLLGSVIVGASRAGSALVIAETLAITWLAARRKLPAARKGTPLYAGILLYLVAFTAVVGWTHLWDRLQQPEPYKERRLMLDSAETMTRERPLTGWGLGNFANAYRAYALFDEGEVLLHAHNDWAEWAVEGGIPALILMLVLAVIIAPAAWRSIWGLGIVSVLLHSAVDFPLHRPAVALWFFTLLGVVSAHARRSGANDFTRAHPRFQ